MKTAEAKKIEEMSVQELNKYCRTRAGWKFKVTKIFDTNAAYPIVGSITYPSGETVTMTWRRDGLFIPVEDYCNEDLILKSDLPKMVKLDQQFFIDHIERIWIRQNGSMTCFRVTAIDDIGIHRQSTAGYSVYLTWLDLYNGWQYSIDRCKTWHKCEMPERLKEDACAEGGG